MIRILAVGSSERINTLMYQLAQEPGVTVDYAHDDIGLARKVVRREAYDLVVLEPDMEAECAKEVAYALKGAARNYCCIIAPRTDMVGYERGEGNIDFVVGNFAKRCMEAYRVFCEGRSDI